MATKKQTTDKKSKTKTADGKTSQPKKSADFSKTYIDLRTVLDALETTVLRYCLMEKGEAERIKHAEEMIKLLKPIVQKYQTKLQMSDGGGHCAEGLFFCNGCCIFYPCPN